jgi:lipopolysaccharide assembly outer membrane protein LptD (OstA)
LQCLEVIRNRARAARVYCSMKLWIVLLLLSCGTVAQDLKTLVISTTQGAEVSLSAQSMLREPNLVHLKGYVEIRTWWAGQTYARAWVIRADEAVYHIDTGEIDPQGNVTARPERRR